VPDFEANVMTATAGLSVFRLESIRVHREFVNASTDGVFNAASAVSPERLVPTLCRRALHPTMPPGRPPVKRLTTAACFRRRWPQG